MKRVMGAIVVVVAGLAASALVAQAAGPLEIGIGGGFNTPVSDFKDSFENGFNVMGVVNLKPPSFPLGLRGSVGYQHFGATKTDAITDGSTKVTSIMGGLTCNLIPLGPVTPYIEVSGGAFHLDTGITAAAAEGTEKKTAFGLDAGVGVRLNLVLLTGFVEGRFENVFLSDGASPLLDNPHDLQATVVTAGVLF